MRPSERIGGILLKIIKCIFYLCCIGVYGLVAYLIPKFIIVLSCVILFFYILWCVDRIQIYRRNEKDIFSEAFLPKYNILWPIVKWLDRNYKEN